MRACVRAWDNTEDCSKGVNTIEREGCINKRATDSGGLLRRVSSGRHEKERKMYFKINLRMTFFLFPLQPTAEQKTEEVAAATPEKEATPEAAEAKVAATEGGEAAVTAEAGEAAPAEAEASS